MIDISVVIATRNREKDLEKCLQSMNSQTLQKKRFEVLVIDNADSPLTRKVIENTRTKYPTLSLKYVREGRVGLSFCRNTGIRYANGTYCAFTDDDATADKNWLKSALKIFHEVQPVPIAIGGKVVPVYETKPVWFQDKYEWYNRGNVAHFLNRNIYFSGPNMIFGRKTFSDYGLFDESLGMMGSTLALGEDTDMFERIGRKNRGTESLYYSPDLVIYHHITRNKISVIYQLHRNFAGGCSYFLRRRKLGKFAVISDCVKYIVGFLLYSMLAFPKLFFQQYWQQWLVESYAPVYYAAGYLYGSFQKKHV